MTDRLELVNEPAAAITAAMIGPGSKFSFAIARLNERRLNGEDVVLALRRDAIGSAKIEIVHRSILEYAGEA